MFKQTAMKRPVKVTCVQYTGENHGEIIEWMGGKGEFFCGALYIPTLEGKMRSKPTDWIIEGVHGEFYPCDAAIFDKTYELI